MAEKFYSNNFPIPSCRSEDCDCSQKIKTQALFINSEFRLLLPPKVEDKQFLLIEILEGEKDGFKIKIGEEDVPLTTAYPEGIVGNLFLRLLNRLQNSIGVKPAKHNLMVQLKIGVFDLITPDGLVRKYEYVGDMLAEDIKVLEIARRNLTEMLDDIRKNYGRDVMANMLAFGTSFLAESEEEFEAAVNGKKPSTNPS